MNSSSLLAVFGCALLSGSHAIGAEGSNQPPAGPLALPPPVQTVAFKKELLTQHPRIILNAAVLDAFREKLQNAEFATLWKKYLVWTDYSVAATPPALPGSENEVRTIGDRLPPLAFAYVITRDAKYLEGARKWIRAVLSYPHWANDVDLGASHVTFGLALAYDWLYPDLTPEERGKIEEALRQHGRILLYRSIRSPGSWWGNAYFQNHCWINHTGIAVAAMALYETDPAEMQRWLDFTRTKFETTYRHLDIDSGYHEGPGYMDYATTWALYYIEALRSVSGENLADMPFLQNLTRHYLDSYMPDGRNMLNFGDCDSLNWGGVIAEPILPWLASHQKDGRAEWMRRKNREAFAQQTPVASPFGLLWLDPSLEPQSPEGLPTTGIYADLGLVVFRTSWEESAAVVALHCGPPGGHHVIKEWANFPTPAPTFGHAHPDANTFFFWSDRQWRVGAPGGYTHDKKTHNENVWTVGGKGQRGGDAMWFESASYFVPGQAQAHLVRVASSPAADYAIGEAAPAYEPDCQLIEFTRHLLFVKGAKPYVVIYDRLKASAPKTWASYLHTYGKIDVTSPKTFQAAGSPPPMVEWQKLPTSPEYTPAFGTVLGPTGVTLKAAPLTVLSHEKNRPTARGFELITESPASESTWLVTVVGAEKRDVVLTRAGSPPALTVGTDKIAWDATGNVSLNDQVVAGNLLPKP